VSGQLHDPADLPEKKIDPGTHRIVDFVGPRTSSSSYGKGENITPAGNEIPDVWLFVRCHIDSSFE
jgi:hypothetical protein